MAKLFTFEKVSPEEMASMQEKATEEWESAITELKMNGLNVEEHDTLVFVTHDAVVVYDKEGCILDMFYLRYPFEIEKRKEKK